MAKTLKVLELFGGIGACSKALERLGIEHEIVDLVEIDKYAVASFNAVHHTHFEPQDILTWDKDIECDLIMHGSPCQDFSVAGRQAGGDEGSGTRSSLMYETLRIVGRLRPKYVIWENVKNLLSVRHRHNFDAYLQAMSDLGYTNHYKVLNAEDYGIPQHRERVFTISILNEQDGEWQGFPEPIKLEKRLKDMLEPQVDEKYYISDAMMDYFMGVGQKPSNYPRKERFLSNIFRKNQDSAVAVTSNAGQRPTDNFVIDDYNNTIRKDQNTIGTLTTNCGAQAPRNGWKIAELVADHNAQAKHQQDLWQTADGSCRTIPAGTHASTPHLLKTVVEQKPLPEVIGGVGEKDSNGGRQWKLQNRVYDDKVATSVTSSFRPYYRTTNKRVIATAEKANFLDGKTAYLDIYNNTYRENSTSTLHAGTDSQQNNIICTQFRIRKLTPKECWRLMGFDDADVERASKVNSNSQLYKQAGNSIVVNVLEAILRNLLWN